MKHSSRVRQPLYLQMASALRDGIASKKWQPGDLLPSETQLCRDFGVSRGTALRALEQLLGEGLAQRRQGVGTFVSRPALHRMPGYLLGFSETVRKQGRIPSHRLVAHHRLTRAQALQYGCGEPALFLHRVRLVDGAPWAVHKSLIPLAIAEKVPALGEERAMAAAEFSLYAALGEAGFTIDHADETVNVRLATAEEAKLLQIKLPSPVMLVHRNSFDPNGRLLESIEAVYLGECYTYETRLVRAHGLIELRGLRPKRSRAEQP